MTNEEIARIRTLGVRGFMQEISENKHCQPTSQARDKADALLQLMQEEESLARNLASELKPKKLSFGLAMLHTQRMLLRQLPLYPLLLQLSLHNSLLHPNPSIKRDALKRAPYVKRWA